MRPRKPTAEGESKPKPSAYNKALGLLARREHSARELKRKLDQGGYAREEAGEALSRLEEQHYQDDDRFAGVMLRNRVSQGYGPARIRAELRSHGVSDAAIRTLLDEAEVDWDALAQNQLHRHYGLRIAKDPSERQRQAQYLQRRGFSSASIRAASQVEVEDELDADED